MSLQVRLFFILVSLLLGGLARPAGAAILSVGQNKPFATPCEAIAVARPGDVIEIDAAGSWTDISCTIYTPDLTIRSVGDGKAKMGASGTVALSQSKGILVVSAPGVVIDGLELFGAKALDGSNNGAGIRVEDGYGVTIRNCFIHDNEAGILTGDSSAEVLVESSELANNGFGDGYSHNIYVGRAARFILRYSYSHHSRAGHLVKSRAAENHILYNRLTQESGDGSYEIDLPDGGRSYVIGNLIQQGANAANGVMVAYGLESLTNPDTGLFVVNNTFVQERERGSFVQIASGVATPAVLRNNIFFGEGDVVNQESAVLDHNFTGDPQFADRENFDYRLQAASPAINTGVDPGSADAASLAALAHYVSPSCWETRSASGVVDPGAHEFGGGGGSCEASAAASVSPTSASLAVEPESGSRQAAAAQQDLSVAVPSDIGLSMSSGSGVRGGSVTLTISRTGSTQPAGLQWMLSFPSSVVSSVQFSAGTAATAAGKTLSCNSSSATAMCLLVGMNTTGIGTGVIANVTFQIASNAPTGAANITISNSMATSAAGVETAAASTSGTLTVTAPATVAVTVSPTSATLGASQTRQFSATVTGTTNTAVTWSISPTVGSISTGGLYSAPSSITSTQTVTVRATSAADTSKSATATVTLTPAVNVTVSPSSVSLSASQTRQFTASVTGSSNTAVSWSISPTVGSISSGGLYTAPSSISSSQTVTVRATSVADTSKFATASVTLVPPAPPPPPPGSAIRVNAGGPAYVDGMGRQWSADTGFMNGGMYSVGTAIPGADAPAVYQSERYAVGTTLTYEFSVPNGTYQLNLKFAEIYFSSPGQRVFHIDVNGQRRLSNFDPCAAAGGSNRPVDRAYSVTVTNGKVTIQLVPVVSNPKISGIEIMQATAAQTIRVNAGGGAYTDGMGRQWSADTGYNTGSTYSVTGAISGADTQTVYQSERWAASTLTYEFPVAAGNYQVKLRFAEIYFRQAGQRVFHVNLNGQRMLTNFDPFAAAGGFAIAVDRSLNLSVTGTKVTIQLIPVVSNVKISGIEILPAQSPNTAIRINAGGQPMMDALGRQWSGDTGASGGSTYSVTRAIAGADAQPVYQSERWSSSTLTYDIAVPNGTYQVNLKFAEIYFTGSGRRVFHVDINGQRMLTSFDPFAAAGGSDRAVDRQFTIPVTGSRIMISLVPVVSNPKISGIEIF